MIPFAACPRCGADLHCAADRTARDVGNGIGCGRADLTGIFERCGERFGDGVHRRLDDVTRPLDRGNNFIFYRFNHSCVFCLHACFPFSSP